MKTPYGHLTYCSNIHPGETWRAHFNELKSRFPLIKSQFSPGSEMGIGLRLSNLGSNELLEPGHLTEFKAWLNQEGAYVFTMNGFPYGSFHNSVVKDQVHAPDWTTPARVDYTVRLFRILSQLLPMGSEGGISTSPLSYKYWFKTQNELLKSREKATANVLQVLQQLIRIRHETGQILHLDIEPEPDGLLESGEDFIDWYLNDLLPLAFLTLDGSHSEIRSLVADHITLCYDICHFAIGFEDHAAVLQKLGVHGIKVGKIQISAALKAVLPEGLSKRHQTGSSFSRFDEPTYLHQVVALTRSGELIRYRDLPQAIDNIDEPEVVEWRAHYHVPVFREDLGDLQSTQSDIIDLLKLQIASPFSNHLEIETYTWDVLPEELKESIEKSVVRELEWVSTIMQI